MDTSSFPSADDAAAATEEAIYGCSVSSSSSSIYHHPFSSFTFSSGSPPEESSPPSSSHADSSSNSNNNNNPQRDTLSSKLQRLSVSPKHSFHSSAHHNNAEQHATHTCSIPPSPSTSYAESQHSMDEYEMDSPSSLSSWNSFMSGHRGDLADVEDLELGEPELATVSEMDEEAPSGLPQSSTSVAESEEDDHRPSSREGLGFGDRLTRRRTITPHHHTGHLNNHHHAHSHSHGHGFHHSHTQGHSGGLSHFSPRAGGHGLSHHSRWSSRTPASVAARRRKGRIAELAEEGEPGGIITTRMPNRDSPPEQASSSVAQQFSQHSNPRDSRCEQSYPGTPPSTQWSEFSTPPPLPTRSVSPSETVPVIPSPLCSCVSASTTEGHQDNAQNASSAHASTPIKGADEGEDDLVTPTAARHFNAQGSEAGQTEDGPLAAPRPRRGVFDSLTANELARQPDQESTTASSPPESISSVERPASTASVAVAVSSPDTTPPSSPMQPLTRQGSLRSRRSSSPVRSSKTKMPLRPCFSRRSSTQGSGRNSANGGAESSSDRESTRGRCHVRFSPAPPQTIRAHSPVVYDRSSCPINNRLSVQDVEEMQKMEMEMGLLSAKCSAIAAITSCKLPQHNNNSNKKGVADITEDDDDDSVTRPRRDSTGSLLRSTTAGNTQLLSPAEHLRVQREKERERACRNAGIGTGLGGRNLGRGAGGQAVNPLIARFGLNTPPPPLPGLPPGRPGGVGVGSQSLPQSPRKYSPSGTPTSEYPPPMSNTERFDRDATLSPPDRSRTARAQSLQRTATEDRALRMSMSLGHSSRQADEDDEDGEAGGETLNESMLRGRGRGRALERRDSSASAKENAPAMPSSQVIPSVVRTDASPVSSRSASPELSKSKAASLPEEGDGSGHNLSTPLQSPNNRTPTRERNSSEDKSYFSYSSRRPQAAAAAATRPGLSSTSGSYGFPKPGRQSSSGPSSSCSSPASTPRYCGYDSPSSAYESGSEYDLIG
ncbi:unnamed protein product [Sympodiomycopsis kandeliae]